MKDDYVFPHAKKQKTKLGWFCFAIVAVPFAVAIYLDPPSARGYLYGAFMASVAIAVWQGRLHR